MNYFDLIQCKGICKQIKSKFYFKFKKTGYIDSYYCLDCLYFLSKRCKQKNKKYPDIIICKECVLKKNKDNFYFKKNGKINGFICKDCVKIASSEQYKSMDKNILKKNKNKRDCERRRDDPSYKLRMYTSKIIWEVLKKNNSSKHGKSIINYLPFTFTELRQYLESLFEPWMTWQNHGKYDPNIWKNDDDTTWKWQLDHIVPQSKLKYNNLEDENFKKCWALSNLRPLSAKQNIKDGARR